MASIEGSSGLAGLESCSDWLRVTHLVGFRVSGLAPGLRALALGFRVEGFRV